jgi:hypothetical protein
MLKLSWFLAAVVAVSATLTSRVHGTDSGLYVTKDSTWTYFSYLSISATDIAGYNVGDFGFALEGNVTGNEFSGSGVLTNDRVSTPVRPPCVQNIFGTFVAPGAIKLQLAAKAPTGYCTDAFGGGTVMNRVVVDATGPGLMERVARTLEL